MGSDEPLKVLELQSKDLQLRKNNLSLCSGQTIKQKTLSFFYYETLFKTNKDIHKMEEMNIRREREHKKKFDLMSART